MTGQATYKHQIAIDLFLEPLSDAVSIIEFVTGSLEKKSLSSIIDISEHIYNILSLYAEESERIEVLREIYHFLHNNIAQHLDKVDKVPSEFNKVERYAFARYMEIANNSIHDEDFDSEKNRGESDYRIAVEKAIMEAATRWGMEPDKSKDKKDDEPTESQLFLYGMMTWLILDFQRVAEIIRQIIKDAITSRASCLDLFVEKFNLDVEALNKEKPSDSRNYDEIPIVDIDIARMYRAFRDAGMKVNAKKFVESLGREHTPSINSMGYTSAQKNPRMLAWLENLSGYLSPEEKSQLREKLR